MRDMLLAGSSTSRGLKSRLYNGSKLLGFDLQELADRLQVSFVILDKKVSCIELVKISPSFLFSFANYPPSEREVLLRTPDRDVALSPLQWTVFLWVDSVEQHCQLLVSDQLFLLQGSPVAERMAISQCILSPITPGDFPSSSLPYRDSYPILGSSNTPVPELDELESASKRICTKNSTSHFPESVSSDNDGPTLTLTHPGPYTMRPFTTLTGDLFIDHFLPFGDPDSGFLIPGLLDDLHISSTLRDGLLDHLERSDSSPTTSLPSDSRAPYPPTTPNVTSDVFKCPIPTCSWSHTLCNSEVGMERARKVFRTHFQTHSPELKIAHMQFIPQLMIGNYHVCSECAGLFKYNNDGSVRYHGCLPVPQSPGLVLVRSHSGSKAIASSPGSLPVTPTLTCMSSPPLLTSGKSKVGYQIDGMARGPPTRSTNLQPYQVLTRTLPSIPLTKNENPLASVKAKHAALRENLAGSNGCTTSGAKQGGNHTGITSLHSPDSDARMGSETNVISDLGRITQPAACTGGYVLDTPQQQSATRVPGVGLSEPPRVLPCISREAAVSPVISHTPSSFRHTSERNAAVNVSDKDHSSDLSDNLADPVNRSGSESSPSNRLVSILFPQGVTPPIDKSMALTALQLPRHTSLDATTVLSVPVDSNTVTSRSVSDPIQSAPDTPLISSLVSSSYHVVPVSKLPPSALRIPRYVNPKFNVSTVS